MAPGYQSTTARSISKEGNPLTGHQEIDNKTRATRRCFHFRLIGAVPNPARLPVEHQELGAQVVEAMRLVPELVYGFPSRLAFLLNGLDQRTFV